MPDPQVLEEFLYHYGLEMSVEEAEAITCIKTEAIMCDWRVTFKGSVVNPDSGGRLHLNLNFNKQEARYSIMSTNAECTEYRLIDMSATTQTIRMFGSNKEYGKLFTGTRIDCIDYFRKNVL